MVASVTRAQVLSFRVRAQQLDRESGELVDAVVLDIGVPDTGPDGAMWALSCRGVNVSVLSGGDLAKVWCRSTGSCGGCWSTTRTSSPRSG